jgi:hypothetical protein
MNKSNMTRPSEFKYGPRAFRQDSAGAMHADIILGLIEAITNCDDSYGNSTGKIRLTVSPKDNAGHWTVTVSDRAGGISLADAERKLVTAGERTSGHESGERKRGNRGRGAKDLAAFGGVKFESVCGDGALVLAADKNGKFIEFQSMKASDDIRKSLGIMKNGTRVTITCRKNIVRKTFEVLKRQLQNAVSLRQIMTDPRRTVQLAYGDREETLRFIPPKIEETVFDGNIEIPSYGTAYLTLYVASESFKESEDLERLGGIVVESGRACHEATLFGSDNHPYASRLFGKIIFEAVDELTRQLDELEEINEDPPDSNPFPIISRVRNGLEKMHPAYKALRAAVRPIIDDYLKRAADAAAADAYQNHDTERRNAQMARELAKWAIAEELELRSVSVEPGTTPALFEIIPSKHVLEHGQEATFTIRARADIVAAKNASVEIEADEDPAGTLQSLPHSIALNAPEDESEFYTGALRVKAGMSNGTSMIAVRLILDGEKTEHSADVLVTVVEPAVSPEIMPPEAFEFASQEYRVLPGKQRKLLLMAPAAIVAEIGRDVILSSSKQEAVVLHGTRVILEEVSEGWFEADVVVEGLQHGGEAVITATTPSKQYHARTKILVRQEKAPQFEIRIEAFPGNQRAVWEEKDGAVLVRVNAGHPAAARYFGPAPRFQLQGELESRIMIAEAVADVAVANALKKEADLLPGTFTDIDALQAKRLRKLNELLPRLHRIQVSDGEWNRSLRQRKGVASAATAA